jgi:hypothetical protein
MLNYFLTIARSDSYCCNSSYILYAPYPYLATDYGTQFSLFTRISNSRCCCTYSHSPPTCFSAIRLSANSSCTSLLLPCSSCGSYTLPIFLPPCLAPSSLPCPSFFWAVGRRPLGDLLLPGPTLILGAPPDSMPETRYEYYSYILNSMVGCMQCKRNFFTLRLEEGEDYVPTSSNVPNDSNSYKYMFPFQHSDTLAFLFYF